MHETLFFELTGILMLGIAAQWIAWRLRVPSILVLLLVGFLVGPIFGVIDPDHVLGDVLFPLVSISVGIILFEGGLTLNFKELRETGSVIRNLITVGAFVSWVLASGAAMWLLEFPIEMALLLGAILVVTGPTVVGPLLKHVHLKGRVGPVAKWEGILIDPVGATLAVLIFEALLAGGLGQATVVALKGLLLTLFAGTGVGLGMAWFLVATLKHRWIPDNLQNAVTLMLVLASQALANAVQAEAGLLAVTAMGVALANQRQVDVRSILEFKKNLQVLLLSLLFITLSARMRIEHFSDLSITGGLLFLALLVFVIRPLSVFASTWRSGLSHAERFFLAGLAPRGIVAAAVSALFSLRLAELGYPGADALASYTFLVIVGTVAFYGTTARPLARWLELSDANPQGVLILGSHSWAREIAHTLQKAGFPVTLVDTNYASIARARVTGLEAIYANALSDSAREDISTSGYSTFLAMTSNPEVNALACMRFAETFGRSNVFQFITDSDEGERREGVAQQLRGRPLFSRGITYDYIRDRFVNGDVVKKILLTEEFDLDAFEEMYGKSAIHMFSIDPGGDLSVLTADDRPSQRPGATLISLVTPRPEESEKAEDQLSESVA